MTKASNVFSVGMEELGKSWGSFLALGILLVVLGIVCLGKARNATNVSIRMFGWILIFSALVWFANTFLARSWSGLFLYLLNAIIRGAAGYLLLSYPDASATSITMVLALFFIVGGVFRTAVASVTQFPGWGWTALSGAVSVVLGILLLTHQHAASTVFIGIAIGIDLIMEGSALAVFSGAIHRLYKAQTSAA